MIRRSADSFDSRASAILTELNVPELSEQQVGNVSLSYFFCDIQRAVVSQAARAQLRMVTLHSGGINSRPFNVKSGIRKRVSDVFQYRNDGIVQ